MNQEYIENELIKLLLKLYVRSCVEEIKACNSNSDSLLRSILRIKIQWIYVEIKENAKLQERYNFKVY